MGYVFLEIGKGTFSTEDFHGTFSLYIGKRTDPGEKEKDKARQAVLLTPTNPFGNDPEEEEPHDDFHSSTESTSCCCLETWPRRSFLHTVIKSAGSRIGILENEIICIYDIRYNTWRLYWSCDLSKRRKRKFRKAWYSKTNTQGNVEKEMEKPAAAAFHCKHRRTQPLETGGRKGRIGLEHKDATDHSTEADLATRKLWQTISNMCVDAHLGNKEVSTNTVSQAEAVKEEIAETNTKEIERI